MRRMVVAAVTFLVVAGLGLGWYLTRGPTGPLPSTDPAAVAAMELQDATKPGWPKHVVDPADYARLLRLFEGGVPDPTLPTRPFEWRDHGSSVPDPTPATWVPVGCLVIDYRSGLPRVVELFRTGNGTGAYQVTGPDGHAYYRGSSDEEIAATLAACLQRAADRPAE